MWKEDKSEMTEHEPIYKRPDLKLIMGELVARQGVAEAVEVIFVNENVYYVDFDNQEPEPEAA
jgi:hypothetical protein